MTSASDGRRRSGLLRWLALHHGERRIVARALGDLVFIDLALRVRGFRRIFSDIERSLAPPKDVTDADVIRARSYARWIDAAARHHLVQAHCLHRSLVLHRWLREEGVPSVLRIGVRTDEGKLASHAWVEVRGELINDRRELVTLFRPLDQLAAAYPGVTAAARNDSIISKLRGARWR